EKKNGKHEASAQSRLDLWKDCWELFQKDPIMGCGPDHWPLHSESFGWTPMKEAHSLWVQTATEMGIPGITLLLSFYGICMWHCWRLLRRVHPDDPPWVGDACRLTLASLCGFAVAAQFVSLETLEVPYYVNLLGISTVMIYHRMEKAGELPSQIQQAEQERLAWHQAETEAGEVLDWRDRVVRPAPYAEAESPFDESGHPVGILN
ncbi:MAG: O-antigen ligase family protein, partial [Planctomycetaceae bacterium]|nr:O-antigen ligase family protein [Planctomycetaceae bacterium]